MMATASENRAQHLLRFQMTDSAITETGGTPNLSQGVITAYRALGAGLTATEKSCGAAEALLTSKSVQNDLAWRALWRDICSWYLIASSLKPDDTLTAGLAALQMIDTSLDFTDANAELRAKQTLSALTQFPDDLVINGKTTVQWETYINGMFAAQAEERGLAASVIASGEDLKRADNALDKENKRIYKILKASFARGSREYNIILRIPTTKSKKKATGTGTTTSSPGLPKV